MGIESIIGSKDKDVFIEYAHHNAEKYGLYEKPFDYSEGMIDKCWELMSDRDNYRSLYNASNATLWIHDNIRMYGDITTMKYRSASETFNDRIGECVDRTFLLITMNNLMGIDSGFVSVIKNCNGDNSPHVCAYVHDPEEGVVLIDAALYGYDAPHKKYALYDRETTKRFYETYCDALNRRDTEDFKKYLDEFDRLDRRLAGMPEINTQQSFGNYTPQNFNNSSGGTPFFTPSNAILSIGGAIGIRIFLPEVYFGLIETIEHLFNVNF